MYKLTLWYSVRNGGDGSAYPHFFESEELAELDQDLQEEGWGESCTGSIDLLSESPILCDKNITTKDDFIEQLREELEDAKTSSYSKHRIPILEEAIEKLEKNEEKNEE